MALIRQIPYSDIVFLAHFTGGGIDGVLDLIVEDYFSYLDAAVEIYEKEITTPAGWYCPALKSDNDTWQTTL